MIKNQAQLLTIENEQERTLVKNTINSYHNETRLVYDGSTYRYYELADFVWIDGVQQRNLKLKFLLFEFLVLLF